MKNTCLILTVLLLISCAGQKDTVRQALVPENVSNLTIQMQKQEIKDNPGLAEPHYRLALIYRELDSLALAITQLDTALQLEPGYLPAKIEKGALLLQAGQIKDGYLEWYRALKLDEDGEYVADIAGRLGRPFKIEALTDGNGMNAYAQYSPDGKKIAFQSNRTGNWDIFVMDVQSRGQLQLTKNPAQDEMPAFSPNSKVIAFSSTRDDTVHKERTEMNRNIYVVDLAGSKAVRIVETGADDWCPVFTNKNDELVLVSEKDDPRDVPFHQRLGDIYLKNLQQGTLLRLTQNEADDTAPSVSRNGKWIVFVSNRDGKFQLYRMDRLGKVTERILEFDGQCGAPDYSRNGKYIAFAAEKNGNFDIYMMTSAGTKLVQLTTHSAQDDYPRFSPDGRYILFHSDRTGSYQIYSIDLETPTERDDIIQLLEDKIGTIDES